MQLEDKLDNLVNLLQVSPDVTDIETFKKICWLVKLWILTFVIGTASTYTVDNTLTNQSTPAPAEIELPR